MSISTALIAGVSGLKANSTALAAYSDNIANVNTIGYKRRQADFGTIVTGQSNRGAYSAGGVLASVRQYVSQAGALQRTTSASDLGITGQGFFVTTEKADGLQATDPRLFTRAGSFNVDSRGFLRNSAGHYLQGWIADDLGVIRRDPSDLSKLSSINVASVGGVAERTTRVGVNANLQSSQPVSAQEATYVAGRMAEYGVEPRPTTAVKPDFEIQIPVSDSKGGQRTLTIGLLKSDTPANSWHAEIYASPSTDVEGTTNGLIQSGSLRFTTDGRLDLANSTLFGTPAPTEPRLNIGASADTTGVRWAADLGVDASDIALALGGATSGISQYDSESVVQSITANGTPFGNLIDTEVDDRGVVTAVFDNGVTRVIGQVALATFPNPDGLTSVSGNAYRVSSQSGAFNLKEPGSGGAGLLSPYTLEGSTVDLSTEFTGLITTQRAYSASSKIITTADEMLEELISIKR